MKDTPPARVRFGSFELELKSGELREGDRRTLLQIQPFKVLLILLEHNGEIVTREEIKKQLWPNDTIVEFDHSINVAVGTLRRALGDSAEEPRYIETLARRGYRLMVPVEWVAPEDSSDDPTFSPKADENGGAAAVLIGKKVSHYRVLEIIGGGGMGLVYKAEDLKLGRRVALKFLPEELANDPVSLQRFEREAQTASSLNHPNICTIYEVEEHEEQPFIVMELLEGETLRDRLAATEAPLALAELLDVGIQVSDGLQAAHERGIIHRDIKPANLFLTSKGVVKILDFGLAKLMEAPAVEEPGFSPANAEPDLKGRGFGGADPALVSELRVLPPRPGREHAQMENSADHNGTPEGVPFQNRTSAEATLTRTGAAMGTAGYMSPEQIRGEKLDARTDIFSFGLVLYEMATGQRPFTGETAAVVHDAIQNKAPVPLREINSTLPPKLVATVDKALEKDRERRYQSAAEMGSDLRQLFAAATGQSQVKNWRRPLFVGVIAAIVFLFMVLLIRSAGRRAQSTKPIAVKQLTMNAADNPVSDATISPDGRHLAYSDHVNGISLLQIDTGESRPIAALRSFRPANWLDGDHFYVTQRGGEGVWKYSVVDGTLLKVRDGHPALPSLDGKRFVSLGATGISVSETERAEDAHEIVAVNLPWIATTAAWSPTGKRIIYLRWKSVPYTVGFPARRELEVDSCDLRGQCSTVLSDPRLQLDMDQSDLEWLPDGRVIFSLNEPAPNEYDSNLWSLEVDPDTGERRGEPKRLTSWSGFSLANSTSSADGKRLEILRRHVENKIKVAELLPGGLMGPGQPLGAENRRSYPAVWTGDSQQILFTNMTNGRVQIFKQNITSRNPEVIVSGPHSYDSPMLTPDGQWLLYTEHHEDGSARVMRMPFHGGAAAVLLQGDYGYGCAYAPSEVCIVSTLQNNRLQFSFLDPIRGIGRELLAVEMDADSHRTGYVWRLSPDGTNIAVVDFSDSKVRTINTTNGILRTLPFKNWNPQTVSWAPDGRHLFLSAALPGSGIWGIISVDLSGNLRSLLKTPGWSTGWFSYPIPSPDGHHIAYTERTWETNAVMLENF